MPWKETGVMDLKEEFVGRLLEGRFCMSDLCRAFQISRKTGYKWKERFRKEGLEGLRERSRRPHQHPWETAEDIQEAIRQAKRDHSRYGPGKLRDLLRASQPQVSWPCRSSFARILKAAGLVRPRRSRRPALERHDKPFMGIDCPNDTWSTDFKGWFRTGRGQKCNPFTLMDSCSRYLIRCVGVERCDFESVEPVFKAAFEECGLPRAIRSDNGPPFASRGIGGLSRLSVWWIKLGIVPERIEPGHPQQNSRHERMHRTLGEMMGDPESTLCRQQERFEEFVEEYNEVRPHDGLHGATPGSVYWRSDRKYPVIEAEMEYEEGVEARRVRSNGEIKWRGGRVFIGEALEGELLGLEKLDGRYWLVRFGPMELGWLDQRAGVLVKPPKGGMNY